ncbi:hypothetical protein [Paracoccus denitrificans]|uniref:hypothetical protein n=1 Tax=Paracoccus denitrificans TaxID=266 RepID=UPI000CECB5D6|nr:hypothetical protein [Paracoccus denitrificans]
MAVNDTMRGTNADLGSSGVLQILRIALALLRITPLHVFLCAVLYILSQISLLAAILLPWKLLTVMATGGIPGVIPEFLRGYPDRELVMMLGASAVASFALYALCEVSIGLVCRHGSAVVLLRHQKVGLFGGHRRKAGSLYRGFLRAVSAVSTIGVIAACLAWIYPSLLFALISYLTAGLAWVVWRGRRAQAVPAAALAPEMKSNAWWGGGFLYAVGWVVADYWHGTLPALTVTFAALLLVRQSVVLAGMVWRTYVLFERQRSRAGALFLQDVPWNPVPTTDNAFFSLTEPERRLDWVRDILNRHDGGQGELAVTECRVGDSGRLVSLTVRIVAEAEPPRAFLIRLFHTSREEAVQHEQEILEIATRDWPAPALLATHKVEGHDCLVYDWHERAYWMSAAERSACLPDLRERLLTCVPTKALLTRYARGRPHLADRLGAVDWDHLGTVVPARTATAVAELRSCWTAVGRLARLLPGQLVIPRLRAHRIGRLDDAAVICNWTRWLWEPVGAGWPPGTDIAVLEEALSRAVPYRPDLVGITAPQARLMAHLYEFERLWRLKYHAGMVRLIPALADVMRGIKLVETAPMGGALPVE